MRSISARWRYRFDDEEVSLRDLSWQQAVRVFRDAEAGDLAAEADSECVSLEFDAAHAAVLYLGPDGVILRPYFPHRPAAAQELGPFFCGGCGIWVDSQEEYLARFLLSREDGLRMFATVLAGLPLPAERPDRHPDQPALPGLEEAAAVLAAERVLEWKPLPWEECKHAEPGAAPKPAGI